MKKFLSKFALIVMMIAFVFALASCDKNKGNEQEPPHENGGEVCAHIYLEQEQGRQEATCETPSTVILKCSKCGDEQVTHPVAALGHSFTQEKAEEQYLVTDATCTSKAVYHKSCAACGLAGTETFNYGDFADHEFIEDEKDKFIKTPGNCERPNLYYKSCRNCEALSDLTFSGSENMHAWGDWETEIESTCTVKGNQKRTCSVCFESESKDLSLKEHQWVENADDDYAKIEATCTEKGEYYKSCLDCGAKSDETFVGGELKEHDYVENAAEKYKESDATCTEKAVYHKSCSVCGEASEETFAYGEPNGHDFVDGICSVCQEEEKLDPVKEMEKNGYYQWFDDGSYAYYFYFGYWPQTVKANNVTIVDNTPDADGYYLGSDGERYARVQTQTGKSYYQFSTGDSILGGATYWFKVEPIKWRRLTEKDGKAFLLCESVLSVQPYTYESRNNYEESNIRRWLQEEFYEKAFGALQKELIEITDVDNSAKSTNPNNIPTLWNDGENPDACENTQDKVFLLSVQEVTNWYYGFKEYNTNNINRDARRGKMTSDYARAMGAETEDSLNGFKGNGVWSLRSPYYDGRYNDNNVCCVSSDGEIFHASVYDSSLDQVSVVPALWINLTENSD